MLKLAGNITFERPLIETTLVRRYKRFLADVVLPDGQEITVHCPNPGAMLGLDAPGSRAWISDSGNPKRKLRYTLELVEVNGQPVGINTGLPNRIAEVALQAGLIPELALGEGGTLRREVKYGQNSRIDLMIEHGATDRRTYIEVKNVHLLRPEVEDGRLAEFPDCVTTRGAKHLGELAEQVKGGNRAVMLYVVQRMDCDRFRLAADLDPGYAAVFREAMSAGVEALAYACEIDFTGIRLGRRLPVIQP
jgi:sugar fermentation stimulation protein A